MQKKYIKKSTNNTHIHSLNFKTNQNNSIESKNKKILKKPKKHHRMYLMNSKEIRDSKK